MAIEPIIDTSAINTTPSATSDMIRLRIDRVRQREEVSRSRLRRLDAPRRRFAEGSERAKAGGGGAAAGPVLTIARPRSRGAVNESKVSASVVSGGWAPLPNAGLSA